MEHIIIGTAGHVDHGKTCLIKALTGVDTDRLAEEKRRGITIELGFAGLTLDDGTQVGVVDVPGHEKFIKNMLAGAGGIDLALLVVAADEGVMPQTREHLAILSLLGIGQGVIAVTKKDLVDADWLQMVCDDVRTAVAGTFLEQAPLVCVSAATGEGVPQLRTCLTEAAARVPRKDSARPFRLPVDRVFSVDGFGTVVTGTLVEGVVRVGDAASIWPEELETKVRNLQVHGADVESACAGQRVAMNLTNVKKSRIARGDTVAAPASLALTQQVDVWLTVLPDQRHPIVDGMRLHLYHGARTVLCRLVLLEANECAPGHSAPAQLRLEEPLACKEGDRFVLRFYSPLETVGGGTVLECRPAHHRHRDPALTEELTMLAVGTPAQRLDTALRRDSAACLPAARYAEKLCLPAPQVCALLRENKNAVPLAGAGAPKETRIWTHRAALQTLAQRGEKLLQSYHTANPLAAGMPREEFRAKLLGAECPQPGALLDAVLAQTDALSAEGAVVKSAEFGVYYTKAQQKLRRQLCDAFAAGGFTPLDTQMLPTLFPAAHEDLKQVLRALCEEGALVLVSPQFYLDGAHLAQARETFGALQTQNGPVSLAAFRDAIGTSRKYALPLLEYFDRRGITVKNGDLRTLR